MDTKATRACRAALALIVAMAWSAHAPADVLSLGLAERLAMRDNPFIQAARPGITAARGQARQDRLWPDPRLTVSGGVGGPLGSPGEFSSRAMVTQAVPLTSRIARDAQVGLEGVDVARWRFRTLAWRLRATVAIAYARLLSALAAVPIARALVATNTRLYRLARARAQAAQISPLVAGNARLLRNEARLTLDHWRARRHAARMALARAMGYAPPRPWAALAPVSWRPPREAAALRDALVRRPDLRLARQTHAYARAQHRYQRARRFGWLTIGAGVGWDRQVLRGVPSQPIDRALALSASLPLPFWNRNQGNRAASRAAALASGARVRALRWEIRRVVRQDVFRVHVLTARAHRYARLRRRARAAEALAFQGLRLGQVRTASTIAVFTEQLTITRTWLATLRALAKARMRLRIALGGPGEGP